MIRIGKRFMAAFMAALFILFPCVEGQAEKEEPQEEIIIKEPENLYAMSAVLMDAESGRILFQKEGESPRPNASTTKVLTCILAIEQAPGDDYVQISQRAASQPEVKLGLKKGEQYYLEDLLYSLMLKSHNDTAVAIAEHIGGSVEGFADMMNAKARQIGCKDTYFITPNGLDETDERGEHHTTARDLALIMRYAIRNKIFCHITQTRSYAFSDLSGKRRFTLENANAFLEMTDGVISGKTGFTGNAGYCYVCACKKDEKTFIISLLGCGWPNNKTYKWKDTFKLLEYGKEAYSYREIYKEITLPQLEVKNGYRNSLDFDNKVMTGLRIDISEKRKSEKVLLRKDDKITYKVELPDVLDAPVERNQKVGEIHWYVGEDEWRTYPIRTDQEVRKITFFWYASIVFYSYFHA